MLLFLKKYFKLSQRNSSSRKIIIKLLNLVRLNFERRIFILHFLNSSKNTTLKQIQQ